jgi:hypothetical protein
MPDQVHGQEHTEKRIECQAKPGHQCGTPGFSIKMRWTKSKTL